MDNPFKRKYYYIVAKANGKLVVWGAFMSEQEAQQKGLVNLRGNLYDIMELPFKNLSKATQIAKARELESSGSIEGAIQRAKHTDDQEQIE